MSMTRTTDNVTPTSPPQVPDLVLTMCIECGTTRTISARAAGRKTLTCATCARPTSHAPFLDEDWREEQNARLSERMRALHQLIERVEALDGGAVGVAIGQTAGQTPITVRRYEDTEDYDLRYWVTVHEDQSIDDKRRYLLRAATWILDGDFRGPLLKDGNGAEYRGLCATEPLRRVSR